MTRLDIAVLGAGSYGTALAITLARKGLRVGLWGRDQQAMMTMAAERSNTQYLANYDFPASLEVVTDLAELMSDTNNLLLVVPSQAFAPMLQQMQAHFHSQHRLVWASKGLEPETGRLLSSVAAEYLPAQMPIAVLSGPTFAKEMAAGMPTAITLAANDQRFAQEMAELLHCAQSFRVYLNDDIIGVQLGGALKNVIAIAAGLADGLGFGANARTALITRGLAEITRLGMHLGANMESFMGMAGLGDLVLTCTDNQSRNRRFGLALGQGKTVSQALQEIGQVVEGYKNTEEAYLLATRHNIEMPICFQLYAILYQGANPQDAALELLGRGLKNELA